tara:strand:- start:12417 stop:13205 length:789 start_codon:yes stop_codon:yes gene_type:complete
MRLFFRLIGFGFYLSRYLLYATWIHLTTKDPWETRKRIALLLHNHCQKALRYMNVKVSIEGSPIKENHLLVGNHMSYLDVFVMAATVPTNFVTSVEIREVPILGFLCRIGGCLFVERRNKENLRKEIQEITTGLEKGLNVTIFPEATSTNGDEILRFRKPLYNAAIYAEKAIQPFCLQYLSIDGVPVSKNNRDEICWYGDMRFPKHFFNLLLKKEIKLQLSFLEPLHVERERHLETLVQVSYQRVTAVYRGFPHSDIQELNF